MIRVTVELVPYGILDPVKIGELKIHNDLTGNKKFGNYKFRLAGKKDKQLHTGDIKGFSRLSENVWKLIYLALDKKYGSNPIVNSVSADVETV